MTGGRGRMYLNPDSLEQRNSPKVPGRADAKLSHSNFELVHEAKVSAVQWLEKPQEKCNIRAK